MEYIIENDRLRVASIAKGAEFTSIVRKNDGKEFLWQAEELWKRRSPLLFPVVGGCKDGKLKINGADYPMPSHGFARDLEFDVVKKDVTSVTYKLSESDYTMALYPYKFNLYVTYTLIGSCIDVNFEVENAGEGDMYFSIGGHAAFNCNPEGESFSDWYVEFEKPESAGRYFKRGLLSDSPAEYLDNTKILKLSSELFENDALVFKDIVSDYVSLKNINDGSEVKVTIKGFPVLILWSKGDRFLCIEPCEGCDDSESFEGSIENKEFMVQLPEGESYDKTYRIKIV